MLGGSEELSVTRVNRIELTSGRFSGLLMRVIKGCVTNVLTGFGSRQRCAGADVCLAMEARTIGAYFAPLS
ncbi:MAG: hypothetical protein WKF77_09945 [Planctomycetaceae bacterium]